MGHQLTFTAVERSGESGVQELPYSNSSATIPWSDWEAVVSFLSADPELQEELTALCPHESDDPQAPSWFQCIAPGGLARTLRRARGVCGLVPLDDALPFRIVCTRADDLNSQILIDQLALVAGDETLLVSVAKGALTRINRRNQTALTEPLRDGLEVVGSPVGESHIIVARVEATGSGPPPSDVLAQVLRVCLLAKAHKGRVHVALHE